MSKLPSSKRLDRLMVFKTLLTVEKLVAINLSMAPKPPA
jgi:hypothetical protein